MQIINNLTLNVVVKMYNPDNFLGPVVGKFLSASKLLSAIL